MTYPLQTSNDGKPIAVIKVGGDILLDEGQCAGIGNNVSQLIANNWHVIILHGGGPQVSAMQSRCGIKPRKVAGRRITSKDDLMLVKQVLCGQVNVDLVSLLQTSGVNAFGCHGASGKLIVAERRPPIRVSGGGQDLVDFGEVGDVTAINAALLHSLLTADQVPVVASLGINQQGETFNINADTTAVQIARQMSAQLLIFVTGVGGIYKDIDDPASRFSHLTATTARQYIDNGTIVGGMIPKVEEALSVLASGVDTIAVADARDTEAFTSIASGETRFGTLITTG